MTAHIDKTVKRDVHRYFLEAAALGEFEIVRQIIENYKNLNINTVTDNMETALHCAVLSQSANVVRLLANMESVDKNLKDNLGNTALHYAAMTPNFALGCIMIAHILRMDDPRKGVFQPDVDATIINNRGLQPLQILAQRFLSIVGETEPAFEKMYERTKRLLSICIFRNMKMKKTLKGNQTLVVSIEGVPHVFNTRSEAAAFRYDDFVNHYRNAF